MTRVLDHAGSGAARMERPAPSSRAATGALAWAEARRLWHSPFYWGGALLSVALTVAWTWTRMPTWETFDQNAGMGSLVLAAAVLIAGHLAAGRDRRAAATETTRTMPAGAARRGLALLVTVPIAAVTGAVVYLVALLLLLPTWPVGWFDPWAAAVVLVLPATGAAIGVLAGRLLPGAAVGPLLVAALAVLMLGLLIVSSSPTDFARVLWPVPDQPWEVGADRPTGWHLLYLLGALVAVTALSVMRSRPVLAALLAVLAVAGSGGAAQREAGAAMPVVHESDVTALTGPAALDCRTFHGVRYCALPRYAGWMKHWREAVEPVAARLPASAVRPVVRQIGGSDDLRPMTPGQPEIVTTTVWGRTWRWADTSRVQMTNGYAVAAVGLARRDAIMTGSCDGAGQHRTVAGLWLIAQTDPDHARQGLASGELRLPTVRYGQAEVQAALALLDRPREEVTSHLAAHWADLLDPAGTALSALGVTLTPPPIPPASPPAGTPVSGETGPRDAGVCR
jgi:hypothetical protein